MVLSILHELILPQTIALVAINRLIRQTTA